MSLKKRLLRILLILVLILAFVGYFAFQTFLFSPIEGDFEYDVSALVPSDVDFFTAKADLGGLFSDFPRLAAMDAVERHSAWQTFAGSAEYQALREDLQLDRTLAELEAKVEQIPLGMRPLSIFGGRDLALAGYVRGSELADVDWAVYGRVNWAGKLTVALLRYPEALGLEQQGLSATTTDDVTTLDGTGIGTIYVTRIRDVVVAGTSSKLVAEARALEAQGARESFFLSARYDEHVHHAKRNAQRDELEVFVDLRKVFALPAMAGAWPDTKSEFFGPAFAGRLFQAPALKEVIGILGVREGLSLDLHGEFDSEKLSEIQKKLYRERTFTNEEVREVAQNIPADAALFVYLRAPLGDLLQQAVEALEPAARTNIEDTFRACGVYRSLNELIAEIDDIFRDRVAIVLCNNDYDPEMGRDPETGELVYPGPPHDDRPVFATAVLNWIADADGVVALRDHIGNNGPRFGLKGVDGATGYYQNTESGYDIREYWNPLISGTGVIATLVATELCVSANVIRMTGHVMKTGTQGEARYPRLSEYPPFEALLSDSLQNASVLVWWNPRAMGQTLRQLAARWAEDEVSAGFDWEALRRQEERRVMPELFPGKRRDELTAADEEVLDSAVTPRLLAMQEERRGADTPRILAALERQIAYVEAISGALAMLKFDKKTCDLSVRVVAPLSE